MMEASRLADRLAGTFWWRGLRHDYTYKEVSSFRRAGKIAAWCTDHRIGLFRSRRGWRRWSSRRCSAALLCAGQAVRGHGRPGGDCRRVHGPAHAAARGGSGCTRRSRRRRGSRSRSPPRIWRSLSFQRFFRVCTRLSGITGTASEASDEFWSIYELPLITVPARHACARCGRRGIFAHADAKWARSSSRSSAAREGPPHHDRDPERGLERAPRAAAVRARAVLHDFERGAAPRGGGHRAPGRGPECDHDRDQHGGARDRHPTRGRRRAAGGLHVILTELHESGGSTGSCRPRAARGIGSTCTFVSTEDEWRSGFARIVRGRWVRR